MQDEAKLLAIEGLGQELVHTEHQCFFLVLVSGVCAQPYYETTVLLENIIVGFLLSQATRVVNDFKLFAWQCLLQLAILSHF